MKNINDILFSFKNTKNNYILFKKILKLFIENNNIDINENKNKFYKKIYQNLLDYDKKKLNSRKIDDIKYLYFIGLRKYFYLNKDRNNKEDFEYIVKEIINTHKFRFIKWWEFKDCLERIYYDKIFDLSKDNVYILNRLKHNGIIYIPFYDLTRQEYIKLLFENNDYDYIDIWENLKDKLHERNDILDIDNSYGFSYLMFNMKLDINEEEKSIKITFIPVVADETIHIYNDYFDKVFDILSEGDDIIKDDNINIEDIFVDKISKNINKINTNILLDIVNKYNDDLIDNKKEKEKDIEKYKIDKHYEHLIKLEKLDRLEKLLKEKIITFEQYLDAIDKIK